MASYFRKNRNVEISTLYYLEQQLGTDWSGVTLVKTFKQVYSKDVDAPIVCVRLASTNSERREIGSTTLEERYLIIVDVFAKSDGQQLDLAYYIKDKLKDGWVHYDHTQSGGSLSRTANGRNFVTEFITDEHVNLDNADEKKDRHRHNISVLVRQSD